MNDLLKLPNYLTGKLLGYGAYGRVYLAQLKLTDTEKKSEEALAIKVIVKREDLQHQFEREIAILKTISHENIISLIDHFEDDMNIYLVTKYYPFGSLYDKIRANKTISEPLVKEYTKQLISAISYLHSENIIHRDIKTDNILLAASNGSNNQIILCDFGWAVQTNSLRKSLCGTLDYLSPEMVNEKEYGPEVDYWSLGVVIYESLTGKLPFSASTYSRTYCLILTEDPSYDGLSDNLSDNAIDILRKLLIKDFSKRLKEPEILNHPFLVI